MTQALKFLQTVLPDQGFYCLAVPVKGQDKSYYKHQVFETIEELAQAAKFSSDSKVDLYYAVGSLKERKVWNEEKQKHQVRTHANMSHFKSLFVDLDCGAGKDFADQSQALEALKAFCKEANFPKPTYILNSGGGVHCYWVFQQSVEAAIWLKLANRFKLIHKHFKFKADPAITSDLSRVLRVPETYNWKYADNPRPVKVLFEGETHSLASIVERLSAICKEHDIAAPEKKVSRQLDGLAWPKELNNLETPKEYDADLIYERCPQMARVRDIGGPVGYSMRGAALSILKITKQQDFSPCYENDPNPATVESQNDQMLEDSITDNPSTCERFENLNHNGCDGCQYKGKIKSPCVLGARTLSLFDQPEEPKSTEAVETPTELNLDSLDAPTVTKSVEWDKKTKQRTVYIKGNAYKLYEPPHPYGHGFGNKITAILVDDTGLEKTSTIGEFMLAPIEVCQGSSPGNATCRCYMQTGMDDGMLVEVPMVIFASNDTFLKVLASNGLMHLAPEKSTTLMKYMVSYIKHLQSLTKSAESHGSLGWDSDDRNYFVTPTGRYMRDGAFLPSHTSDNISEAMKGFKTKGTLEGWLKVVETYNRPGYEDYQFGHLVGYGSLVFPFSGDSGAVVSMVGATGSGKSTVLETINSMFGPPKSYLTKQDTMNAKMNRLGIYKNYPITYDEISNIDPEELSTFIYSVSQGRSKLRLDQNSNERSLGNSSWQLILSCTTNHNLVDRLSTLKSDASAESVRLFEYYIHRRDEIGISEARDIFDLLKDNYGHAGNIFIEAMVKDVDGIVNLYKNTRRKVEDACNATQKERFWLSVVASTITGGIVAKSLGLHNYDMEKVMAWAIKQIENMRGVIEDNIFTPQQLLVDFMNSTINRTLVLAGGTDDKGRIKDLYPIFEPTDALWCRLEKDNNVMYVDARRIKDFFSKGGSDYNTIKRTLVQSKIVLDTMGNKVLSKDSNKAKSGNVRCWKIDLSHPEMAGASLKLVGGVKKLEGTQVA